MIRSLPSPRRWFPLLALFALCRTAAAASPAVDGWQMLWQNHNVEARTLFRQALKQNSSDPAALRGLGVLNDQEEDLVASLQARQPLYRLAPAHWSAAAYWPRMVELAWDTGRWSPLNDAARDLSTGAGVAPELRASAQLALAEADDRAGHTADAARRWSAMAYLTKWQVIGPFDNVSLSGFDKPFPPEHQIDLKNSYVGKDGQPLRWHALSLVGRDGQCAVGESLGDEDANVYYMATALYSPRDQQVHFCCDPTGASKLFLNGRLIYSDEVYRQRVRLVADPLRTTATLRKGWNSVLVKLADDEQLHAAYALRLTGPTGADAIVTPADPAQTTAGAVASGEPAVTATTEPTLVSLIRKTAPAGDPEAAATIGTYLRSARDLTGALEVLQAASAKVPSCGWLRWELSRTLQEDEQGDEARAAREQARKQNPRLVAAVLSELEDDEQTLPPAQKLQRVKELRKRYPQSGYVLWALAEAYDGAELNAESLKAARAATQLIGGPGELSRLAGLYQAHERKTDASSLLAAALRSAPGAIVLRQARARLLRAAGNTAAALAEYERLAQLDPASAAYLPQMVDLYRTARNSKKAIELLHRAREQRPQDAAPCTQLADLLREQGQKQAAISLYREAVRLEPSRVALREKLQLLTGERPVVDLVTPTAAAPILAQAPNSVPGASSMVLLDEARQVVYPDYATVSRARLIIKVFDASAAERYQRFPLGGGESAETTTLESAQIIKPDGKVQKIPGGASLPFVSLPSLAPGDIIDVSFRVEGYPHGGLAGQFWDQWSFAEDDAPVRLSRYVLITPPDMPVQSRGHGGAPEPATKELHGWRVREWRMADIPARKSEPSDPGPNESRIWLDLSTVPSWRQIVAWYRDLAQSRCTPDAAIRAKAAELTREAKTPREKLQALVAFVSREIQYQTTPFRNSAYVPTQGKQVLRERYGDCKDKAALLTAMLASVGIKANMVLLSGRSQGLTPYLPSPRFNHAIARVELPDGPLWVDATADQLEFGGLPAEDQEVPALVIDEHTTDLTRTAAQPIERNQLTDSHQATLGADEKLTGKLELRASGDWAWMLRSVLRRVPEASRDEALRGMGAAMMENARCDHSSMENLADPDQPLVLGFQYQVEHYSSSAGNFLLMRLPWNRGDTNAYESLLANSTRQRDVETSMVRGLFVSTVRLDLPPGYVPQDLQPEVKGESPWGSYRITYRLEGNTLHARRELKLTPLRVTAGEFPRFLEFLKAVDRETHKQLVLRKP